MPTLLAKNASVLVTMDDGRRELSNAGLFVSDGVIEQVGPTQHAHNRFARQFAGHS
jgi:8-oxoguanine deaminase